MAGPGAWLPPNRLLPRSRPSRRDSSRTRFGRCSANHCLDCHGPQKQESGLRLDSRASGAEGWRQRRAVRGGRAIPSRACVLKAVRREGDYKMPPNERERLLPAEIETLTTWIKLGPALGQGGWPGAAFDGRAVRAGSQLALGLSTDCQSTAADREGSRLGPRTPSIAFVLVQAGSRRPDVRRRPPTAARSFAARATTSSACRRRRKKSMRSRRTTRPMPTRG